jgi:hypothetical protein
VRPHREIVLQARPSAVEKKAVTGVGVEQLQDPIDGIRQARSIRFERSIPLPVPVEMGDEQAAHTISYALRTHVIKRVSSRRDGRVLARPPSPIRARVIRLVVRRRGASPPIRYM